MAEFTVKSGSEQEGTLKHVTVTYHIPASLNEMVEKYGEETVYEFANRAVTQAVQNLARARLNAGEEHESIQKAVHAWTPGVRGPVSRKSPFERAQAALGNMSKEELEALLAKVKAAAKAA